jgi:hypothetical protein
VIAVRVESLVNHVVFILNALESVENNVSHALSRVLGLVNISDAAICHAGRHAIDSLAINDATAFSIAVISAHQFAAKFAPERSSVKSVVRQTLEKVSSITWSFLLTSKLT